MNAWRRLDQGISCPTTMSKRVLITFLFTADPLALIWWGFSPILNTKLQAQHVELPRAAAARLLEVWQV